MLPGRINSRDLRGKPKIRSDAHRKWIRTHFCCVPGCKQMPIDCAHVSIAGNRGAGLKPSDAYTISLCHAHHMEQHQGTATFERKYKISMVALAKEFFARSPHRHKLDDPWRAA